MKIYFRKNPEDDYHIANDEIRFCRPYGIHNSIGDYAVIDVEGILEYSKKKNIGFNLLLSHCISHEQIHSTIEKLFPFEVSVGFDNIYQKLMKAKSPFHILGTGV